MMACRSLSMMSKALSSILQTRVSTSRYRLTRFGGNEHWKSKTCFVGFVRRKCLPSFFALDPFPGDICSPFSDFMFIVLGFLKWILPKEGHSQQTVSKFAVRVQGETFRSLRVPQAVSREHDLTVCDILREDSLAFRSHNRNAITFMRRRQNKSEPKKSLK